MAESPETILRDAILDDEQFVEAVFQGARPGAANPWQRVTIRPVLLRDERHLQFVYFDGTQTFTSNYTRAEQASQLAEVMALPFKSASAATANETVRIQYSKKGRPILHRERHQQAIPLDMAHDRAKPGILNEEARRPSCARSASPRPMAASAPASSANFARSTNSCASSRRRVK